MRHSFFVYAAMALVSHYAIAELPAYRWLNTTELADLLKGRKIIVAESEPLHRIPEEFHQDGRYVRYGHQEELVGTFQIVDGEICIKPIGANSLCRRLLKTANNEFWIVNRDNPATIVRVLIQPIHEKD